MAGTKEIRTRIKSVQQTLKITNAMYLISSANLRKAKGQLDRAAPYFTKIDATIADILHRSPELEHEFFDPRTDVPEQERKVGYIVVSGDKGLAGAYNHNVLRRAEEYARRSAHPSLFVVGQVGRSYFLEHGIPIDVEFLYTAQDPNMGRARDMAELMLDLYLDGQLDEVYVLFTKMVSSFQMEPTAHKLLPLDPDVFPEYEKNRDSYNRDVVYVPSVKAVMDRLVPGYVKGDLFGALVESYCSEQNARMTAMKSSSDNARAMLQRLNLSFNRARQAAITQEITEVVGGAQAAL